MKYKVTWKNTQGSLTKKHPAAIFIYTYAWEFCSSKVFNNSFPRVRSGTDLRGEFSFNTFKESLGQT